MPALPPLRVRLGAVVQRRRREAGYSQEAFADRAGVHRTFMSTIERGRSNVSLDTLERIAARRADHADKAERLVALAAASVGVADPLDAGAVAVRALLAPVAHLEQQIADLAARLDGLLATEAALAALLTSVPGVGAEPARTWLAEAPPVDGLRHDDGKGAERLVAVGGIDAQLRESGQRSGRVRMSKRGTRYLRRAVLLAAQNAARVDPQCKALLVRQLQRGKHYNVAVSHVGRKLVHIIFAVLRRRTPYTLPGEYRLGVTVRTAEALATT